MPVELKGLSSDLVCGKDREVISDCSVHVDVFSAMSGVSRFVEPDNCVVSKLENATQADLQQFTFLVTEKSEVEGFRQVLAVAGYSSLRKPSREQLPGIVVAPQAFVHRRLN
mmetsp:Transcript_5777/g.13723  ORF Transcript_5777/g.13723 Transcript_5777/m.13723 type:complete len:112 (+) Transcript_5777:1-336(+)